MLKQEYWSDKDKDEIFIDSAVSEGLSRSQSFKENWNEYDSADDMDSVDEFAESTM